jgi:hypothetical protein
MTSKPVNNTEQNQIVGRTAKVLLCRASHQTVYALSCYLSGDWQIDPNECAFGNRAEHRAFYASYLPANQSDLVI